MKLLKSLIIDFSTVLFLEREIVFNTYKNQLCLTNKEDVIFMNINITNILEENNNLNVEVILEVKEENKEQAYKLLFKRELMKEIKYCSNCGRKLDLEDITKCKYCGNIITNRVNYVMINHEKLN